MDLDEDFMLLVARERKGDHTAEGRRKREMQSISSADAKALRGRETRHVQLGVRVRPSIKARAVKLAVAEGISTADLIERAIEAYEPGRAQ